MSNQGSQIVQKLWNCCNVLRDDLSACDAQAGGMSYGVPFDEAPFDRAQGRQDRPFGSAQSRVGKREEENGTRNSFSSLLLPFSGGRDVT
jgi:hypothetical protein